MKQQQQKQQQKRFKVSTKDNAMINLNLKHINQQQWC
jgi:hypothetical protein